MRLAVFRIRQVGSDPRQSFLFLHGHVPEDLLHHQFLLGCLFSSRPFEALLWCNFAGPDCENLHRERFFCVHFACGCEWNASRTASEATETHSCKKGSRGALASRRCGPPSGRSSMDRGGQKRDVEIPLGPFYPGTRVPLLRTDRRPNLGS